MAIAAIAGLTAGASAGQQRRVLRVDSARIGQDHRVYLRWTGQREQVQPRGEEQADVSDLRIAPDRGAAAWLVGRTDLSDASYPEEFELLVAWNGGRPHSIFPGRVISQWQFEDGGRRIALWDETGHGAMLGKAALYDVRTGKLLGEWDPVRRTAPPSWAAPFHAEWDSGNQ